MDVFWEHGFDGTSLDALEQSTGLNRSSLYNAFGGKLELFGAVLDAYRDGPCRALERPLRELPGSAALHGYLAEVRAFVMSPAGERGCLMVNTALWAEVDANTRSRVQAHFSGLRKHLSKAYHRAIQERTVDSSLTPDEGAEWLLALVRGVLASAASGESRAALERALNAAEKQLGTA